MHKMNRLLSVITAALMFICVSYSTAAETGTQVTGNTADGIVTYENRNLCVSFDTQRAVLTVKDLTNGAEYTSVPNGELTGINRVKAMSPLILTLIDEKGSTSTVDGYSGCVADKDFEVTEKENGFMVVYRFKEQEIEIPVFYELRDTGLAVHIEAAKITDKKECLLDIALHPYFAAAADTDNGYFLIPDGSGAVVNFNNGRSKAAGGSVSWSVYGTDALKKTDYYDRTLRSVNLPLFGMHFEGDGANSAHGLIAWLESGAAMADLNVKVSDEENPYNNAYYKFNYRPYTLATLLDRTDKAQKFYIASARHTKVERFSVEFCLLGEKSSYSDMAAYVSDRIFAGCEPADKGDIPVFLDVYMSVYKQVYTLGIPRMTDMVLTTTEQCESLLEELGGEKTVLLLRGLTPYGASGGKISTKFTVSSKMGGIKDYSNFVKHCSEKGAVVYPVSEFVKFTKGTFKYNGIFSSARSVTGKSLKSYWYNPATLLDNGKISFTYLSAPKIPKAVENYLNSCKKQKISTTAPLSLGNSPYTDNKRADREETANIARQALEKIKAARLSVLLENPDAYAIKYADHIIGMPTVSSGNYLFDYDVPFLQMVSGRYVIYGGENVDACGDYNKKLLNCAETGSALTFTVSYGNYEEIRETELDFLYSADHALSGKRICETVKQYNGAMRKIAGSYLTAHERVADGVFISHFSNGVRIVVNYSDKTYCCSEVSVEPGTFMLIGNGGGEN